MFWGRVMPAEAGSASTADHRLTVVVITRNRRYEVDRTLRALAGLPERPPVIVVDNGSADGTAAAVRRAGAWQRLLDEPRRNSAARRYVG